MMSSKLSSTSAGSRKNQPAMAKSKSKVSILDKLQMLRSFCGSTWSEKDLSCCLSQSGYSVELAAERLMTGQYKTTSRQGVNSFSNSKSQTKSSQHPSANSTSSRNGVKTSRSERSNVDIVTPSHSDKKKKRPAPIHPTADPESSLRSVTPKTPKVDHPSAATNPPPRKGENSLIESSWLLCHRWVSNGTCTQRNGSVDYKEILNVEHTDDGQPMMLRFRGQRMVGQFPKHMTYMFVPLLRATPEGSTPIVLLQAEALMEERNLPVGADVAFSLSVWLPNPKQFFDLFDKVRHIPSAAASQFFQKKKDHAFQNRAQKSVRAHEAAFALLQWAQEGEKYIFPEAPPIDGDANGEALNGVGSSSDDEDEDENNVDNIVATVENEETPEWARSIAAATDDAVLPEFDAAKITTLLKNVELRPYQRQALNWMMQRELPPSESSQEDIQKQLKLLVELSASSSCAATNIESLRPENIDVHCECGPVVVSPRAALSSRSILGDDHDDASIATHPLWQRRYLASYDRTQTMSFFVQPLFETGSAVPPQPPLPCRGGILADSMGLGKTVMLLSLICQSKHHDSQSKANSDSGIRCGVSNSDLGGNTTLVVAPLSLLAQWEEELLTKTSLSYFVHYGDKKLDDYSSVDVVVTTYGTIQGELQSQLKKKKKGINEDGNNQDKIPGLLGVLWKRVILDECHSIKNNATIVSRACCLLRAERRWCVSGTIIQNSLDDVYALLKFLRHEPWCERSFWKKAVVSESDLNVALGRVRRVLGPIMIRRTKESRDGDGNPILTLPPIETKTVTVDFTPAERQFYDELHLKSLSLFQGFIKAGTASKSWLAIFSLLHRLRQACDHVALTVKAHLNEGDWNSNVIAKSSSEEDDTAVQDKKTNAVDAIDNEFLNNLMNQFRSMQSKSNDKNKEHRSGDDSEDYASKVANILNDAVEAKSSHLDDECAICLDPIDLQEAVVTPCFHIFCKKCLVGVLRDNKSPYFCNDKSNKGAQVCPAGPCPVCNKEIDSSRILKLEKTNGRTTTSYLMDNEISNRYNVGNSDGVEACGARQVLEDAIQGSNSSKQLAILKELQSVWEVDPRSKVLIFSQFLGFLDLLELSFRANKIPFARLDGKLSLKERVKVLEEFGRANPEGTPQGDPKSNVGSVLLISMKAGGVGLNLVAARTVFIADPWWNAAVEDQCVNRIHRIGQTAEMVRVRKFYVSNSVEERIVLLQKRKKDMASEVLCDGGTLQSDNAGMRPTLDDFKILFRNN